MAAPTLSRPQPSSPDQAGHRPNTTADKQDLTPSENKVLDLIGLGKTNKEIAAALNRSVNTVGSHRSSILRKLGFHSTAELVRYAALRTAATPVQ
jgi:DNA-binding NarL/FixJ family response regulator